jgi:hypothetical protein
VAIPVGPVFLTIDNDEVVGEKLPAVVVKET